MPRKKPQAPVKQAPAEEQAVLRGSITKLRLGNRTYDLLTDNNCPVCMHPGRGQIEEKLIQNWHYPSIAEWVSNVAYEEYDGERIDWPQIEAKQLASHFRRGHVTASTQMVHQLAEERDAAASKRYEQSAGRVVDHMVFAKATLARVEERAARGEIEPTFKEGVAIAKLLADHERASQQIEQEDRSWFYEQAMEIYFAEARKIMSDDQWVAFSHALQTNPTLAQLTARAQNPDVQDAEIVPEIEGAR